VPSIVGNAQHEAAPMAVAKLPLARSAVPAPLPMLPTRAEPIAFLSFIAVLLALNLARA
jgi:hypothetical protein